MTINFGNLGLRGNPPQRAPRASDQLPVLQGRIDPGDLESRSASVDPTSLKLGGRTAMAITTPPDTLSQAQGRDAYMNTPRLEQQIREGMLRRGNLLDSTRDEQAAQMAAGRRRLAMQQASDAQPADTTAPMATAAERFSGAYRAGVISADPDPVRRAAVDAVARRQAEGTGFFCC